MPFVHDLVCGIPFVGCVFHRGCCSQRGFFVGPEYGIPWLCVPIVVGAGFPLCCGCEQVCVFIIRFLLLYVRAPFALCVDLLVSRYRPCAKCAVSIAGGIVVGACRCACVRVNVT